MKDIFSIFKCHFFKEYDYFSTIMNDTSLNNREIFLTTSVELVSSFVSWFPSSLRGGGGFALLFVEGNCFSKELHLIFSTMGPVVKHVGCCEIPLLLGEAS